MLHDEIKIGLTFDDVLLIPAESHVLPNEINLTTNLTKNIKLSVPFMSAAMDTVTEYSMAIAMAQIGGIGIVHRNMTPEVQASHINKVKKYEAGIVSEPITIKPDQSIDEAEQLRVAYKISGFPVVSKGKLIGILTNRDLRSLHSADKKVRDLMTGKDKLITAPEGTTKEDALKIIHTNRIEKLPIINAKGELKGLMTLKDLESHKVYPNATKDDLGRLRVGAAVGVGVSAIERIRCLDKAGVDVIVIDTAHGHSKGVLDTISEVKEKYPHLEIIAGNVATFDGAEALVKAGASAVKVGVGPGSICTTRIVAGVGVPQITAVHECARAAHKYNVPLIADGGIKFSGDAVKALAAGADVVMMGSVLAGTEEAPGEAVIYHGRSYKAYRGMGSIGAMSKGCKDRYSQEHIKESDKLVPEGIEGRVSYKGRVELTIYQFIGGVRSGMGYTGSNNISALQKNSKFVRITPSGLRESHVHDVIITKEAPNYRVE